MRVCVCLYLFSPFLHFAASQLWLLLFCAHQTNQRKSPFTFSIEITPTGFAIRVTTPTTLISIYTVTSRDSIDAFRLFLFVCLLLFILYHYLSCACVYCINQNGVFLKRSHNCHIQFICIHLFDTFI